MKKRATKKPDGFYEYRGFEIYSAKEPGGVRWYIVPVEDGEWWDGCPEAWTISRTERKSSAMFAIDFFISETECQK